MAIQVADIISGAYLLLGRPSQADLHYEDMLALARDVLNTWMVKLKLSARGHTLCPGSWDTPTDTEMPSAGFASGYDGFLPVKMEWRHLSNDGTMQPAKAEIVAYEQLADLSEKAYSETYVAFYDNNSMIAFSETAETLASREYRLWFEPMSLSIASVGASVPLPEMFVTLCKYDLALLSLDVMRNDTESELARKDTLRKALFPRYMDAKEDFDKWSTTAFGNKKITKLGFRPRRGSYR